MVMIMDKNDFAKRLADLRTAKGVSARDMSLSLGQSQSYINNIENIFSEGEVDQFYVNFCDPWPKARHAKRRLTHIGFLRRYSKLLKHPGKLIFKTDNRPLFDFSLEQFEEAGLKVDDVSFDLHGENRPDNIMTEYERKFSGFGEKINRCEVTFP